MHTTERTEAGRAREAAALESYKARGLRVLDSIDWAVSRLPFRDTKRGREQRARLAAGDRETGRCARDVSGPEQVRPRFGFHYIRGNSGPYFSLTGDVAAWPGQPSRDHGGGCCHETIVEAYPELAPLVPWHLCNQDGEPIHYVENARWAFLCYRGQDGRSYAMKPYGDEARMHWTHGVKAGALGDGDAEACAEFLENGPVGGVDDWLAERAPKLRAAFVRTMADFGVPMIPGHLETVQLEDRLVRHDWLVPADADTRNPLIPYADRAACGPPAPALDRLHAGTKGGGP